MMPFTAKSSHLAKPARSEAACISSTIRPMEFARVPSQSKISSLYSGCTQPLHGLGPHVIHRSLQFQFATVGQRHGELIGMEEQRSEEHTSELQSLMRISYAVFCLKKKKNNKTIRQSE